MCGIIGIVGKAPVALRLAQGLHQLEYRGYDSSGIATVENNTIYRLRAQGKLVNLDKLLEQSPLPGVIGIGHTRWATHGLPTENNAHPHATANVALVHNGIIENFRELKQELQQDGVVFTSETDTEVVLHLVDRQLHAGLAPKDAVSKALTRLQGAFALGIIFAHHPEYMIAARKGSPLAIGYGEGEMYMGSDAIALSPFTSKVSYLEDGDLAVLSTQKAEIYTAAGKEVMRPVKTVQISGDATTKGNFEHYMLKEIHEQPTVIANTMNVFCNLASGDIQLPPLPFDLQSIDKISLVACGTSYYAALVARYELEKLTRLPVTVDIASEYRYRPILTSPNALAIFISQSGETADTLAAMRAAKAAKQHCIAVVNVAESTMANEADAVIHTYAGPEISVASTKGFTTQLTTLACFAIGLASARGTITPEQSRKFIHSLAEVPSRIVEILHNEDAIKRVAALLAKSTSVLFMGRGTSHAIALEGALKLKELSYIHAEGYAAGEFKHGPLALVDKNMPVVVIAPSDFLFEKTASNVQEVAARGGRIILISDAKGCAMLKDVTTEAIEMPEVNDFANPLIYVVPVQLLAYRIAVLKGNDIDQPRNLAKSVTVE